MRRLDGAARAGRAARYSETLEVERDYHGFALQAVEENVGRIGSAARRISVNAARRHARQDALLQAIAQMRDTCRFLLQIRRRCLGCDTQRQCARHVFGAGAALPFVTPADLNGPKPGAALDVESPDSLRRM